MSIADNTTGLEDILRQVNELPEAGGGSIIACGLGDMNLWSRNSPAVSAYKQIDYNKETTENVCSYYGVSGHEFIGFKCSIPPGKTLTFSLSFCPVTDITTWDQPHGAVMGIFQDNMWNTTANAYEYRYSAETMHNDSGEGYIAYSCTYKNTSTSSRKDVSVGLYTGRMNDGVSFTFNVKDVRVELSQP